MKVYLLNLYLHRSEPTFHSASLQAVRNNTNLSPSHIQEATERERYIESVISLAPI